MGRMNTGFLGCACLRSRTKDEDDEDANGKQSGQGYYYKHSGTLSVGPTECGSLQSSLRGFQSFSSSIEPQAKAPGAETFTMAELSRATANFSQSNKIGQGGFGMVYKGRLKDGRIVAIKRGKKDAFEPRLSVEFRTEVEMLSQVRLFFLYNIVSDISTNMCGKLHACPRVILPLQ